MKAYLSTAALAALVAGVAVAAQAQPRPNLIGVARAVAIAEDKLSGKAFDAELDHDRGSLVYEVSLVRRGQQVEVDVDAVTGLIVRERTKRTLHLPYQRSALDAAQSAPRDLAQTIAMIETSTKGRVSDIGLERRGGRDYYEVELAGAQDREVFVDLRTGAITPKFDD